MFGLGMPELIVVLVIAFLVFGANRLPELGSGLGKAIRGFKDAAEEVAKPSPPQAIAQALACPHCGSGAPAGAGFCAQCGKALTKA